MIECLVTSDYFFQQENNGTWETLITQGHSISNSTLFKDRVKLGTDNKLYLSPVQIHDDDRKFSCRVVVRSGKILRHSTTVKVFGKRFCSLGSLLSSCPFLLPCSTLERKCLVNWRAAPQGSYSRAVALETVIHGKGGNKERS